MMRRVFWFVISFLGLSGCSDLATIPFSPEQTPESWLQIQPYLDLKIGNLGFVFVQPSSSIFVYLLGIITIGAGLYFFKIHSDFQSRKWWGIALLLWGVGALLAGTSYQAFSYEIKCAGRVVCSWTSWWEIIYLLLSATSVDAMLVSGAYSSCRGKWRKILMSYAILNAVLYSFLVFMGTITLNKFLISFELLLIVTAPNILILFFLNGWRYFKYRTRMDLALLVTWVWLGATIGAYFTYLAFDFGGDLWDVGIWFSENDVLHIGLISWMIYIAVGAAKHIKDELALI